MSFKYEVQTGFRAKGKYETRYSFDEGEQCVPGSTVKLDGFKQALFYYGCINIGNGYKKRLIRMYDDGRKVVINQCSS